MPQQSRWIADKDKERALEYVRELLKHFVSDADRQIHWQRDFSMDRQLEVLSQRVNLGAMSKDDVLVREIVMAALVELAQAQFEEVTLSDFEQALGTVIRRYTEKPEVEWHVLCPLYLDGPRISQCQTIQVLGVQFTLYSWGDIGNLSGMPSFWQEAQVALEKDEDATLALLLGFVPLMATRRDRIAGEAFRQVEDAYNLLRALINLVDGYGRRIMQFGKSSPLAICLPPPVFGVFGTDYAFEALYLDDSTRRLRKAPLSIERGVKVAETIERLSGISEAIRPRVVDAILKFGQAVETTDWRSSYLSLWQALESLAFASHGTSTDDIVRRIANLLRAQREDRELLTLLSQRRNELVHLGRFSQAGLRQVMFLKLFTERAISRFLTLAARLPTPKHWQEYYDQLAAPTKDLRIRGEVIQYIVESTDPADAATVCHQATHVL